MTKNADGFAKQSDNSISPQIERFAFIHSLFTILSKILLHILT